MTFPDRIWVGVPILLHPQTPLVRVYMLGLHGFLPVPLQLAEGVLKAETLDPYYPYRT